MTVVFMLAAVPATAIAVTYVIGRLARWLLGWDIGPLRMAVGGVAGSTAYFLLGVLMRPDRPAAYGVAQAGIATGVAMSSLVAIEAAAPTHRGPALWQWSNELRRRVTRTRRAVCILAIAHRHGVLRRRLRLDDPGHRQQFGVNLRHALEQAGVTFVKLGQFLATRPDLVSSEVARELSVLHHDASALPLAELQPILVAALGRHGMRSLEVEPTAAAAASIAQVHAASRHDASGREPAAVAVKIRRPGITGDIERDLDIVRHLARWLERHVRGARSLAGSELVDGFANALRDELDLRIEARNLVAMREAAQRRGDSIVIPRLHPDLSTSDVLTTEWLDGTPISAIDGRCPPERRERIARDLLHTILRQILDDGVFHADPHPGNVMLLEDGRVALLDFGSVGRLDRPTRTALAQLLLALDHQDPSAACDALLDVVVATAPDVRDIERSLGRLMAEHLMPPVATNAATFTALYRLVADHRLQIPPHVAAAFRAITTLDGTLRLIDPGFELVTAARAFAGKRLRRTNVLDGVVHQVVAVAPGLAQLPRQLLRITRAVERGELNLTAPARATGSESALRRLADHLTLTVIAVMTGVVAALLMASDSGPRFTDTITLNQFLGYNVAVVAVILTIRALASSRSRSNG